MVWTPASEVDSLIKPMRCILSIYARSVSSSVVDKLNKGPEGNLEAGQRFISWLRAGTVSLRHEHAE